MRLAFHGATSGDAFIYFLEEREMRNGMTPRKTISKLASANTRTRSFPTENQQVYHLRPKFEEFAFTSTLASAFLVSLKII